MLDREHDIAKEAVRKGQTERARMALRRRAYQTGLIQKTDQQLATLQDLVRGSTQLQDHHTHTEKRFRLLNLPNWSKVLCTG